MMNVEGGRRRPSRSSFDIPYSTFVLTRLAVSADGGFGRRRSVWRSAERKGQSAWGGRHSAMRLSLCALPPACCALTAVRWSHCPTVHPNLL
jgi:hypothetical protein